LKKGQIQKLTTKTPKLSATAVHYLFLPEEDDDREGELMRILGCGR